MAKEKTSLPLPDTKDITVVLNKITIFAGLSDKQLQTVSSLLRKASYKSEEYIFREGQEPSHIYVVLSGRVKIIVGAETTPLEIITFSMGQCFGETSVIAIQPHSASAMALEDTELIVLSRKALLSIFESDKELFGLLILNIAREACRRLHKSDETLLHYFSKR